MELLTITGRDDKLTD
jgi:hypothetical protein